MALDRIISSSFYSYALFVYRFKYSVLFASATLMVVFSSGLCYIHQNAVRDPPKLVVPSNGKSYYEKAVMQEHFPLIPDKFIPGKHFELKQFFDVCLTPRDGGNILRPNLMKKISQLNKYIMGGIAVPLTINGTKLEVTYETLCLKWGWACFSNEHIDLLNTKENLDDYLDNLDEWTRNFSANIWNTEVHVTYPIAYTGQRPIYMANVIGEVTLNQSTSRLKTAGVVRMVYALRQDDPQISKYSKRWIELVEEYLLNLNRKQDMFNITMFHSYSLRDGLGQVSEYFRIKFSIAFCLLLMFSILFSVKLKSLFQLDWVKSKVLLALTGILSAIFSISSALGILLFMGMPYNPIVLTMPFLIISIGIDDMFILVSAWHRSNPSKPTDQRLADTLNEAAVSVTITSLTDFLSFAVGCYTYIPVVWMFCAYTAVAIAFCFFYQLTFFTAVMAITGDWEANHKHCIVPCYTVPQTQSETGCIKLFCGGHTISEKQPEVSSSAELNDSLVATFFRNYYGPMIMHPIAKVFTVMLFVVYMASSIYGCLHIHEGLNPERLVLKDHYLSKYYRLMNEAFWDEGDQAHIIINNPPDLSNPEKRKAVYDMVSAFEDTEHTMQHNATMFWMFFFEDYLKEKDREWENTTRQVEERISDWLRFTRGRKMWISDTEWIKEEDGHQKLNAFRLQVGLRHFNTPNDHRETAVLLREIASRYPEFNITTYHQFYPFADQYLIILPSTLRNLGIAVVCMVLVAVILIPSVPCAILITMAIISIDVGVLGFMTFWDVSLDCVSMITLIMCIGFAVDLSAHICYAYVTSPSSNSTPQEKVVYALEHLGWPVLLGAVSSILGMLALISVEAYIVSTFFKTVFLVIVFGLMHSLLFLPVALTFFVGSCSSTCNTCKGDRIANYDLNHAESMRNSVMSTVM